MLNPSEDVDAPILGCPLTVTEALEGNLHLDVVPTVDQPTLGFKSEVRVEVDVAFQWVEVAEPAASRSAARAAPEIIAPGPVLLNAQRVHPEQKGDLSVIVGIEQDLHVVFRADVVPIGLGGPNRVSLASPGSDPEVDRVTGIPHQDLRWLGSRPAIHRLILREIGEPGGSAPNRLAQVSVDRYRRVDPWERDVELSVPAAEYERGVLGQYEKRGQKKWHGGKSS